MKTTLVSCVLAIVCLAHADAALAADGSPLSATPPTVTLDSHGAGKVVVSNGSARALTVRPYVVAADGSAVPHAVALGPPRGMLRPGESAPIAITGVGADAATLVVVADPTLGLPLGSVLRVPLQHASPPKPAVSAWTLHITHQDGTTGRHLPLTGKCGSLKDEKLGTLQAHGNAVTVTGTCTSAGATFLELGTHGVGAAGRSYTGKITFGGADVDMTVEDTWPWWGVLFLLVVGVAAALWLAWWRGWGRSANDLLRRTYVTEQLVSASNPRNADTLFREAAEKLNLPPSVRGWTVARGVTDRLNELRAELRAMRAPTDAEVAATRKALDDLDAQVRAWPQVANRLGELANRAERLLDLTSYLQSILARTLGRAGPLDPAAMADVKAAADEALALAAAWPAETIHMAKRTVAWVPGDAAVGQWHALLQRLHEAPDDASARAAIGSIYDANTALQKAVEEKLRADGLVVEEETEAAIAGPLGFGLFEPVDVGDPGATARDLGWRISALDKAAFAFLLAVALVAGMQALWVDKTFGGFWDVASAIVWGSGSAAVAAPLSAALGDTRKSAHAAGDGS